MRALTDTNRWSQGPLGPIPPRVQKALAQLDEAGLRDEKETLADLIRQSQAGKEAGEGTAGRGAAEDDTFKSDSSDEAMFWGFQPCSRSRWHRTHHFAWLLHTEGSCPLQLLRLLWRGV